MTEKGWEGGRKKRKERVVWRLGCVMTELGEPFARVQLPLAVHLNDNEVLRVWCRQQLARITCRVNLVELTHQYVVPSSARATTEWLLNRDHLDRAVVEGHK